MRSDKLGPDKNTAENDLEALEKVIANDDYSDSSASWSLARTNRLYDGLLRRGGRRGGCRGRATAVGTARLRRGRGRRRREHRDGRGRVRGVHAARSTPVFGVVVHEHVVRGRQHCVHVDRDGLADRHLESTHVARVSRVLQAVLVAFEEEFHEESSLYQGSFINNLEIFYFICLGN